MRKIILLLLVVGLVQARPVCGNHQYHDFTWENNYAQPARPVDTLLDSCNSIGIDEALCRETANPNLTAIQKRELVLSGLVNNSGQPDFETAKSWDGNIRFTKYAPDNVSTRSTANIRDAWNKVVAVYPSLYSRNGTLLVNTSEQVDSKHGFSFVVRKENFAGDCATEYEICGYDYSVADNFGTSSASSSLSINTQYLIHHSHLVRHCVRRFCFTTCDYYGTDDKRDSLNIVDEVRFQKVNTTGFAFVFVDSMANGLADAWLVLVSSKETNYAKFAWENSSMRFSESAYKLVSNFTPYNVAIPKAVQAPNDLGFYGISILERENKSMNGQELAAYLRENESVVLDKLAEKNISLNGIETYRFEKIHLLAPVKSLNCGVDFYGHFTQRHESGICYFSNQTPAINLSLVNRTNVSILVALRFYDEQTDAPFSNSKIKLGYGNQSLYVLTREDGRGQAAFNYSATAAIVFAEFKTDLRIKSAKAQLPIPKEFPLTVQDLMYFVVLILVLFLLVKFAKRVTHLENS